MDLDLARHRGLVCNGLERLWRRRRDDDHEACVDLVN
jgi:hypothetical protein